MMKLIESTQLIDAFRTFYKILYINYKLCKSNLRQKILENKAF